MRFSLKFTFRKIAISGDWFVEERIEGTGETLRYGPMDCDVCNQLIAERVKGLKEIVDLVREAHVPTGKEGVAI